MSIPDCIIADTAVFAYNIEWKSFLGERAWHPRKITRNLALFEFTESSPFLALTITIISRWYLSNKKL
jgi:hypothetical protein